MKAVTENQITSDLDNAIKRFNSCKSLKNYKTVVSLESKLKYFKRSLTLN